MQPFMYIKTAAAEPRLSVPAAAAVASVCAVSEEIMCVFTAHTACVQMRVIYGHTQHIRCAFSARAVSLKMAGVRTRDETRVCRSRGA